MVNEIIDKRFQRMLDKSVELDWHYMTMHGPDSHKALVKLGLFDYPEEDDFAITIDLNEADPAESFLQGLLDYAKAFDVDSYVEKLLPKRGKGNVPLSIRELLDHAELIIQKVQELSMALDDLLHPELSSEQVQRCDNIYTAVHDLCKVITENASLEWDMQYLAKIADLAVEEMVHRGYMVRFPAIITDKDGFQYIEEYYEPS